MKKEKRIKCSLCGFDFRKEDSGETCKGCLMKQNCGFAKCPNCGFENTL